jgi:hypothetical protein
MKFEPALFRDWQSHGAAAHFVEACRRHKPNAIDETLIRVICIFTRLVEQFHRRGSLHNLDRHSPPPSHPASSFAKS